MELPKNDASLRDVMYLVKNGISFADALALSSEDQRRCARAFAELQNLTLIPEDGMRWKRREHDYVQSIHIDGGRIAAVMADSFRDYSLPSACHCLGVPDADAA